MSVNVLGIDPGLANFGWAVVELGSGGDSLVALGVVRTSKSSKKRAVLAADDNLRRSRELADQLGRILHTHRIAAIAAESMSFPRNASTAAKMSLAWGVVAALAHVLALPVLQTSPQELKRAVTGDAAASKEDVQAALCLRHTDAIGLIGDLPGSLHEHAFDAAGAVVATLEADVMRALRPRAFAPLVAFGC